MHATQIVRAAAAALLAAGLVSATTAAESRTEVTVTHGIGLHVTAAASWTCGFLIELHTVGKEVSIRHYDDRIPLADSGAATRLTDAAGDVRGSSWQRIAP
jgi:hypothetical protein